MAKHLKMIVDSEFLILFAPRSSIGLENRRVVDIEGFVGVGVALRNDSTDAPLIIKRILSTATYEAIDSCKLMYGGAQVLKKLAKFQLI